MNGMLQREPIPHFCGQRLPAPQLQHVLGVWLPVWVVTVAVLVLVMLAPVVSFTR